MNDLENLPDADELSENDEVLIIKEDGYAYRLQLTQLAQDFEELS